MVRKHWTWSSRSCVGPAAAATATVASMLGARPSPASLSTWIARCAISPARWYSRCLTAARRPLEGASVCPC
eukprot:10477058-Lingulodinium_polyedra.AAC.1